MEDLFETLADRTRLRILNLVSRGELCVCYFTSILGAPQPTISRHLAHLRRAGLVSARRDGKWIHYSLAPLGHDGRSRILKTVLDEMGTEPQLKKDVETLQRACCAVRLPRELADAPRPVLT
jgi:ArsR family transcriptional regulator